MSGYLKVPALLHEVCPRCSASNDPVRTSVWRVADERGLHFECDVCAHEWKLPPR